ncbi:MAG: hypothetical protein ACJ72W_08235 [Actinoallomurus sp.]
MAGGAGRSQRRKKLIETRTSELQRLAKVLEDGGIKIHSAASSLTTLSARDTIEALIAGERNLGVLAELALHDMTEYRDLGADYFTRHDNTETKKRRLIRELQALDCDVTIQPAA